MKIIIKIEPDKDPERTLNYFYEKCLDIFKMGEIEKFDVEIDGEPKLKKIWRKK